MKSVTKRSFFVHRFMLLTLGIIGMSCALAAHRVAVNLIGHSMPRLSRLVVAQTPARAISIAPNLLLTAATKVTGRQWNTFAASIGPSKLTKGTSGDQA